MTHPFRDTGKRRGFVCPKIFRTRYLRRRSSAEASVVRLPSLFGTTPRFGQQQSLACATGLREASGRGAHTRNHSGSHKVQAPQNEVYFRRAAPGEGGARGEAVGGPGGNILFCGV